MYIMETFRKECFEIFGLSQKELGKLTKDQLFVKYTKIRANSKTKDENNKVKECYEILKRELSNGYSGGAKKPIKKKTITGKQVARQPCKI